MKSRHLLFAAAIATAALLGACNDKSTPPPTGGPIITNPTTPPVSPPRTMTISEFVSSLFAMVTGAACNTATPAALDSVTLTDDMSAQDANALSQNCAS